MSDLEFCIDCKDIRTSNRKDGDPVCSSCSNKRYSDNIARGRIIELKLDMSKIRRSTYLQIQALIAKDMEDALTIKEPA